MLIYQITNKHLILEFLLFLYFNTVHILLIAIFKKSIFLYNLKKDIILFFKKIYEYNKNLLKRLINYIYKDE